MADRTKRISAATLLLVLALAPFLALPLRAWPSVCDQCMEGIDQWGHQDARCCLEGGTLCQILADEGYYVSMPKMEYCTETTWGTFEVCEGREYSCTADDGGGGGGGSCHIQYGDLCPAECPNCTRYY